MMSPFVTITTIASSRRLRWMGSFALLALAGAWALNLQFGVREVHRAESPLNYALALTQPSAADWPGLFGPDGTGRSGWDGSPFASSDDQRWQAAVPGDGIGGACVWGDFVMVPVVDSAQATVSLWTLDRRDGQFLRRHVLHRNVHIEQASINHATGVPACDGQAVYLGVVVQQRLLLSAVELNGQLRWTCDVGPMSAPDGRLVSPRLFGPLVLVAADHPGTLWNLDRSSGHLTAVHRQQGEIIWRVRRRNCESTVTPVLAEVAGRPQLMMPAPGEIRAYDPGTGGTLWFCRRTSANPVSAIVNHGRHVFAVSDDRPPMMLALRADGSGDVSETHILWHAAVAADAELPPVADHDALLCLNNDGSLACLDSGTGKLRWRRQLPGGYAVPPVLGGGRLLCVNTQGTAVILDLAQRGEIVAEQSSPDEVLAPPAVTSQQLILRTRHSVISVPWDKSFAPLVNSPKELPRRL